MHGCQHGPSRDSVCSIAFEQHSLGVGVMLHPLVPPSLDRELWEVAPDFDCCTEHDNVHDDDVAHEEFLVHCEFPLADCTHSAVSFFDAKESLSSPKWILSFDLCENEKMTLDHYSLWSSWKSHSCRPQAASNTAPLRPE